MTSKKKKTLSEELEAEYGTLSVGAILRAFRQADETSQKDYAKILGISPQSLNDLENGRRLPTPERAARIAKKIGLPEKFLIQMVLRDSLRDAGLNYTVKLESA
jgi:transcriptional regulator with XRE-family HTH domain